MGIGGATCSFFIFETLLDADLRRAVIGRDVDVMPAALPDMRAALIAEGDRLILMPEDGTKLDGLLLTGLSDEELARLEFYGAVFACEVFSVKVETTNGPVETQSFRSGDRDASVMADWSLSNWQAGPGKVAPTAAIEIMRMRRDYSPEDVANRMSVIRTRAQARVNAESQPAPKILGSSFSRGDVRIFKQDIVYSNFFSFEEVNLKHRTFAGDMGPEIQRGVTMTADAATVLPYDPTRDRVLLVEQFRASMLMRGDRHPWGIEAIAGRLDPGETPESTVHREAMEEAGLKLGELHFVGKYYSSPGSNTEFLYSYVAECDLPDDAAGLGGLIAEGEDIRAVVVEYATFDAAVRAGDINIGPLLLTAFWLRSEREALRQRASG